MPDAITSILVIEDETILRESLAGYLEDRDFRVVTAENGRMGLELFERERPDLVLTDLRMPEVDGLDVLRRAGDLSPETPLIVVSGTGNISDSIQALRFGAWDYILKPVEDMSIIALAVDKALERARLRRENREYQERLEVLVRERTTDLERANTELSHINARLRRVVETTHRLSACTDVAGFSATLLNEFVQHMAATGGSLFLLEDDGLRQFSTREPNHVPRFIPFPLPDGSLLKRAIAEKKPLLIVDIVEERELRSSGWDGYRNGPALLFPLPDETGRVIGVMTLHSKTLPPFVEQDKEIGAILASSSCETLRAVRATETLRASEARFRDLADMLPEAIFETDRNLHVTYANRRAFELFGYAASSLPDGLTMHDMVIPEDRDRAGENLAGRLRGEHLGTVEYQAVKRDGSTFPILFHASVVMKKGALLGLRGIAIDITERKQAEDEIHALNQDLEQRVEERTRELQTANQALEASLDTLQTTQTQLIQTEKTASLGRLVAGVAHELNTPIGIGVTAASYLEQQTRTIETLYSENSMKRSDLEHFLKTAAESTGMILGNLHRAAEQIRSFKQVAVDQSNTEKRRFYLKKYIDEILLSLTPKLKKTGHTISVSCSEKLELDSYPGAFSQIFTNFVINSLNHGFEHTAHGEIIIEALIEDDMLHLRYRDDGKGIAEEELTRIFDPFYTTARGQGGTGLGLHVVYNLVTQRLCGRIRCESPPGKGITFHITIPRIVNCPETR
ncbi:MAG: response regulator [bacterium]|nr:response regulator [bacterium]